MTPNLCRVLLTGLLLLLLLANRVHSGLALHFRLQRAKFIAYIEDDAASHTPSAPHALDLHTSDLLPLTIRRQRWQASCC
jgi:hypothetical protein